MAQIQQHFVRREKRSFGFWNSLDYFLERSVFRAELRVQCPICAFYNWFDLDAISSEPTCSRCLKKFNLRQAPGDLAKIEWFYRVIGPCAAPNYVRGGYSVGLTLRCIADPNDTELTWATGLELNKPKCEIDFAAWYRRTSMLSDDEHEEPVFVFGEAKSFGRNSFDDDAISNLRLFAERFPGSFMLVSALKTIADFSREELDLIKDLARWGRMTRDDGKPRNPLIILTGTELFSDRGIDRAWSATNGIAKQFAGRDLSDLYQLAEITQQLYLGLPRFTWTLE